MEIKKNITSIFMVPTLQIPKDSLNLNCFINAYIKDLRKDHHYDNSIYLLFKPTNLDKFREFLDDEYDRTKNIIEDYDYENGYVVIVYMLDVNYINDFNLIKQGKYSKTSIKFQKLFSKTVKINKNGSFADEYSLQYRIFNKTEDLINFWEDKIGLTLLDVVGKDFEVWEGWDESKEILEFNK